MNPISDLKLRILQFALAAVAAVVALLLVTDAQIAGVLGLSSLDLDKAPLLLGRLRLVFRLALLLFLVFLLLGLFLLVRRSLFRHTMTQSTDSRTGVEIVAVDDGIKEAIEEISRDHKAQTLKLWGYSLGWASKLSQHLEGNPQSQLSVEVFVPDGSLVGRLFDDPKAEERTAVLRLRLDEWKALAASRRVKSVRVFAQPTIPNDLGLMVDQRFALLHSYDWDVDGNRLTHKRQAIGKRRFLRVSDGGQTGKYLLEQLGTRLLCRCYDAARCD